MLFKKQEEQKRNNLFFIDITFLIDLMVNKSN